MKRNVKRQRRRSEFSRGLSSDGVVLFEHDGLGVDSHVLGGVVSFVDANETIGDLKHVVPQGDDDELSVLCLLLHREEGKEMSDLKRV